MLFKIDLSLLFKPCTKSCALLLPVLVILPVGLLSALKLKFSNLSFNNNCDPPLLLIFFCVVSIIPTTDKSKLNYKSDLLLCINVALFKYQK